MRVVRVLVAGGLVLLLSAVPTLAAQGSLQGRFALPVEAQGPHTAAADAGAFVLEGPDGAVSLLLQGAQGRLERVIHRSYGYVNPDEPKLELSWDDDVERVALPLDGALVSLSERRGEFKLLADEGPVALASGPRGGDLLTGLLESPKTVDYTLDRQLAVHLQPPSAEDAFSETLAAGLYQSRAMDGRATLEGPFRLFLSDAVVEHFPAQGASEKLLAHFRIEERPGALYNPLKGTWSGPGTHVEYVQEYLLLEVASGRLDIQFAGLPGTLYGAEQSVAVEGRALLPAFHGRVTVTDEAGAKTHELRGEDLAVAGLLDLHLRAPDRTGATSGVAGEGDFTHVAYGQVAESYDWATVAAAVGAGAVALAALAWLAVQAKALLAPGALVAGYARVHGPKILEHPGRSQVYDMVKANAGISFMELARALNLGESTLTYHVRVLERNGFVSAVKDGRYLRYYDRQAGTYAGEKKVLVSALRNRTTAAIARMVQERPGIAQRELAEAFHIAPSTVNWHIKRLAEVGLVDLRRDHPHTRYYLGQSWASLPAEEQARLAAPVAVTA